MRILQLITRSEPGGAQAVAAGLAAELVKAGHEVAIASGEEGGGEAWRGLDSRIELFEVGGLGRSISPLADMAALLSIRRLYRQWKPDIVHVHTSKAAALGRMTRSIDRGRIVYTMHGYGQLRREHKGFLPIDRILARRTGAIVAVSRCDERSMRDDGYRSVYIANGVPDTRLASPGDEAIVHELRSMRAQRGSVALLIAREAAPKRLDLARGAAVLLGGRTAIAWIGGEPRRGDPKNFRALGRLPRAAAYLAYADMIILPSDHEGMPISVLEGFAAGLPAIVSAVEGCIETVGLDAEGRSERGIAVANTAEAFAFAIDALAEDRPLRESMGVAARAAWDQEYSLDAMASSYIRLYKRLADSTE